MWEGINITDKLKELFHKLERCTGCRCTAQTSTPMKNDFSRTEAGRVTALILLCTARKCSDAIDIGLLK